MLYNLGIKLYLFAAQVAWMFNHEAKAGKFYEGRVGLLRKIEDEVKTDKPIIWFHCSSVGEFEQARPIIEWYRTARKDWKILLTFFSPSGYELRKDYSYADWVYYLPVDTKHNAKEFIRIVNPRKAVFVKYEFWYNYLKCLRNNGTESYLISAIFRPGQSFFKPWGGFFREMLHCFNHIFVQNKESFELLSSIGLKDRLILGGDTRFDRVATVTSHPKDFPQIDKFVQDSTIMIAGSSWPSDEVLLFPAMEMCCGKQVSQVLSQYSTGDGSFISPSGKSYGPLPAVQKSAALLDKARKVQKWSIEYSDGMASNKAVLPERRIKVIIAPHEMPAGRIEAMEKRCSQWGVIKFSQLDSLSDEEIRRANVLIVDAIGYLSSIYKYADFSFVGGGFIPSGIHNILESATYGAPVCFGPTYRKFQEAHDAIAIGGAVPVIKPEDLCRTILHYLSVNNAVVAGALLQKYVKENLGATEKIIAML